MESKRNYIRIMIGLWFLAILFVTALGVPLAAQAKANYEVYAIKYGTLKGISVAAFVPDADLSRKMDASLMVWLVRGAGHNILIDTGFCRKHLIQERHVV